MGERSTLRRLSTKPGGGLLIAMACGLTCVAAGVLGVKFGSVVLVSKVSLPIADLGKDYILALVWAAALSLALVAIPIRREDRIPLFILWAAMLAVALVVRVFVENVYPVSDAFASYRNAKLENFGEVQYGRGTPILTYVVWLHQQYLIDSFHAIKVTGSFIGLWAIYFHYRAATLHFARARPNLLLVVGLLPGILFWATMAGKEPIVLFGIGAYAWGVVGLLTRRTVWYTLLIVTGIALAGAIRVWLALIMVAPLFTIVLVGNAPRYVKALVFIGFIGGFAGGLSLFADRFQIVSPEDIVETADTVSQSWARGGSGQSMGSGLTSFSDMVKFMPIGAFTALFRPLPGEVRNVFGTLASLDNILLLGVLYLAFRRTTMRELNDPVIAWALAFVVVWSAIYGFASYQNLGTAVRFKLQVLPLLWLVLLYLARPRTTLATTLTISRRMNATSKLWRVS